MNVFTMYIKLSQASVTYDLKHPKWYPAWHIHSTLPGKQAET